MTLQKNATPRGRRTIKFTPANLQRIKDWVAEGISREEIARLIDVTVGSLQVTCSRLGISLRTRQYSNGSGSHWWVRSNRTALPLLIGSHCATLNLQ